MAQTVPLINTFPPSNGVTYKCDSTDGDDVHVVAEIQTRIDSSYYVKVVVLTNDPTNHDVTNSYELTGTFQNDNGSLTVVGTPVVVPAAETDGGWSANLVVNDTTDRIQVQLTLDASHTSSAPVSVRVVPLAVVELGKWNPHFYGAAANNPA